LSGATTDKASSTIGSQKSLSSRLIVNSAGRGSADRDKIELEPR